MGDSHSFDFVGVLAETYNAGDEMESRFLDRFRNQEIDTLWVNSQGKILKDEDQLIAHTDPGDDDNLVLTDDLYIFQFSPIGEKVQQEPFFGNMSFLMGTRRAADAFEEYLEQLIGMVLHLREKVNEPWKQVMDTYSFVTLWEYYETSHYTEDGTESDEYWQLLGMVDMNRAKEITTILDGVEPFEV